MFLEVATKLHTFPMGALVGIVLVGTGIDTGVLCVSIILAEMLFISVKVWCRRRKGLK
jgi:hypothetical protein